MHLKTPDGQSAVVVGGSVRAGGAAALLWQHADPTEIVQERPEHQMRRIKECLSARRPRRQNRFDHPVSTTSVVPALSGAGYRMAGAAALALRGEPGHERVILVDLADGGGAAR